MTRGAKDRHAAPVEAASHGPNDAPQLDEIAWYGGNSDHGYESPTWGSRSWSGKQYHHERAGTRSVRGRKANPLGLHDMLGNVWEWCAGWYGPYDATRAIDPVGPLMGMDRVLRGGSWYSYAKDGRAAQRIGNGSDILNSSIGFRLARDQYP